MDLQNKKVIYFKNYLFIKSQIDKSSFICTKYHNISDVKTLTKSVNISKAIILGASDINLIDEILSKDNINDIIIYEKDYSIITNLLHKIKLPENKNVMIFTNNEDILNNTNNFIYSNFHLNHQIFIFSSNEQLTKKYEEKFFNVLDDFFGLNFEYYFSDLKNISDNITKFNYLSLTKQSEYPNLPILLIFPGPSLEKNLNFVKKNNKNLIIACVGSALYILYKNGIEVDLVFSLDNKERIVQQFNTIEEKYLDNLLFIASSSSHPKVLKLFKKIYLVDKINDSTTVGHFALNILLKFGQKVILTLGNDNCLINNKIYSSNVLSDIPYELRNKRKILKGNFDSFVESTYEFENYITLYEKILKVHPDVEIFNLSEGAYINGMTPLLLSQIKTTFVDISSEKVLFKKSIDCFKYKVSTLPNLKIKLGEWLKFECYLKALENLTYKEIIVKLNSYLKETKELPEINFIICNIVYSFNITIKEENYNDSFYKNLLFDLVNIYISFYKDMLKIDKKNTIVEQYLDIELYDLNNLVVLDKTKLDNELMQLAFNRKTELLNKFDSENLKICVNLYFNTIMYNFKDSIDKLLFNLVSYENHFSIFEVLKSINSSGYLSSKLTLELNKSIVLFFNFIFNSSDFLNEPFGLKKEFLDYFISITNDQQQYSEYFNRIINNQTLIHTKISKKGYSLINLYANMVLEGYERTDAVKITNIFSDFELRYYKNDIRDYIKKFQIKTLLDYGCGGSNWYKIGFDELSNSSAIKFFDLEKVFMFEPARNIDERQIVDCLISFDVLEHIFISDIPTILREMFSLTNKLLILNIACYDAAAKLPNGENAHITVREPLWWKGVLDTISIEYPHINVLLICSIGWRQSKYFGIWASQDWDNNTNFKIDL